MGGIRRFVVFGVATLVFSVGVVGQASPAPARTTIGAAQFSAGYALTPTHGVASVSTTFTVPTITCTSGGGPGQSFGVWGFDSQTGYVAVAAVQTYCVGTTPTYNFYILANSTNATESGVGPGDKVVASFYQTPGWTQATVHDLKSGVTWVQNWATTFLPASTIWIGAQSIPGNGSVAPFASSRFTNTQVNGDLLGYQSPAGYNWVRFIPRMTTLVATSAIANFDTFTLVFRHS